VKLGYDIAKIKQNGYFVIKATKEGEQTVIFVNHSEHQLVVDSFRDIAREVARVLPADVVIDDVALILGNWTTTTAISTELRSIFPNIRVTGIEDATAPVYYEQLYGSAPELVNGQGLQMTFGASARKVYGDVRLKFDDVDLLDQIMLVNPITRDEVRDEVNNRTSHGLPINVAESIGNSSAAALSVARSLAETKPPRAEGQARVILILAYDHLDRYGEAVPFRELANHPYSLSEITAGTRIGVSNPHQRSMIPPGPSWRQAPVATLDALPTSIDLAYYGPVGRIMANASLS
jgi:cysteine synthase